MGVGGAPLGNSLDDAVVEVIRQATEMEQKGCLQGMIVGRRSQTPILQQQYFVWYNDCDALQNGGGQCSRASSSVMLLVVCW